MREEPNWLEFFQDRERLHAEYYLAFVQQHARRDREAYDQLEAESGNWLKTAGWLAEQHEAKGVLRLVEALWQKSDFIRMRGFLQRGLPLLEQARQAALQIRDIRSEFVWLEVLAQLHLNSGNPAEAQRLYEQALILIQDSDEPRLRAQAQLGLGRLLMELNDLAGAGRRLAEALQNYRQSEDYAGEIETLTALGNLYSLQGDSEKAIIYLEQGLPLSQAKQDQHGQVALRFALGYVGTATQDWLMAIRHYEPAIDISRAIGNRHFEVRGLHNIGEAWLELGYIQKAVSCLEEAVVRQEIIDDVLTKAFTHFYLGKAYHVLGEWDKSLTQLKQTYPFRSIPIQAPLAAEAAWMMANNHLKLGNADLARPALADVLSLVPDHALDICQEAEMLLETIERKEA